MSRSRTEQVAAIVRERGELEQLARRQARAVARDARGSVMRLLQEGRSVTQVAPTVAQIYQRHLDAAIAEAMLAGHLTGYARTAGAAQQRMRVQQVTRLGVYEQTIATIARRLALPDDRREQLAQRYGNEAARVTRGQYGPDVERQMEQAIAGLMVDGQPPRNGVAVLQQAMAQAGLDDEQPYLLETLIRTQVQTGYAAGRWEASHDPAVLEILWGYEYVSADDSRSRPTHAHLDGLRAPAGDPVWGIWWPPNGFNCRCTTIEVFRDEPLATPHKQARSVPDEGFTTNIAAGLAAA